MLIRLKKDYYLLLRRNDNIKLKDQYKCICKRLKFKIKEAKELYYNTKIIKSPKRSTIIWNIVNDLTGKNKAQNYIHTIKVEDCVIDDQYEISL
jgi:hypothetical protein